MHVTRKKGVVHHSAIGKFVPVDREVGHPFLPRVLLDQLLVLHHHELEIVDPVLLRDLQLLDLGQRGLRDRQPDQKRSRQQPVRPFHRSSSPDTRASRIEACGSARLR
jgi:hypothetical protein